MLLEQLSIHAWIQANAIKTESGDILDFKKYRFLFDIYSDRSPLICCMKAAQIGFTTYEILKTAHECKNEKYDIIYVLPTMDDVKKFSGGKTNKMIAQNPVMQTWTKDKDSVEQKQFGNNTIYYQGSWTERAALMITAKKLVVDEYDRCKPEIVEQYDSRLQSIANPKKAYFSNPSMPDFGIDKFYKMSDQKKWHITHSCGETFVMDEGCVDYEAKIYRCPKCKGEILDEERRMGEWKATAEGKWSGYWIPLWIAPWMPASKIAEYKYGSTSEKAKSAEYFANFVAGLPYIGGGNKVMPSTIIRCLSEKVNDQEDRVIIGVDTGLPIHYVLANKQGYFYYGTCSDPSTGKDPYKELEDLLVRFPKSILISDQGGDLIGIRSLQAKYPGRVFLVWYQRDKSNTEIIKWGKDTEYGKVVADRNRLIQLFIDEMTDKRVTFNGTESEWQDYIIHWMNIYRSWEENALGVKEFKWERQGPDHFVHACLSGNTLIETSRGLIKIEDVIVGDYALTRRGYRKVSYSEIINQSAYVLEAEFSNGTKIIATPEHRFWTQDGWKELQNITMDDILLEWNNHSTVKFTNSIKVNDIWVGQAEEGCIETFGNTTMARSRKDFIFTIKTAILSIIPSRISKWLMRNIISLNMDIIKSLNLSFVTFAGRNIRQNQQETINSVRLLVGQKNMRNDTIKLKDNVGSVVKNSPVIPTEKQGLALKPVRLNVLVSGTKKIQVYGITVEDTHEYFANGILVANSIYARIGLDKFSESMATIVNTDVLGGLSTGRIFKDF